MLRFGTALDLLSATQFQGLVSALLVLEHPRVQCMPLEGRDGGRDAIVQVSSRDGRKFKDAVIYQAKHYKPTVVGKPTASELQDWAKTNIRRELPKIKGLEKLGATEYVFVTNLPASGAPRCFKWVWSV